MTVPTVPMKGCRLQGRIPDFPAEEERMILSVLSTMDLKGRAVAVSKVFPAFLTPPDRIDLLENVVGACEEFAIAHELSHHFLWHTRAETIEAIADILVILNREDAYEPETPRAGEIDFHFVKNRYGPTATVTLAFQGHYCRIVDLFISNERHLDWSFKTARDSVDEQK